MTTRNCEVEQVAMQVKEKYHRMQKLPEFEQMISRLGKSQPGSPTIAATAATGSPQKRARDAPVQPPPCMITPSEATSPTEVPDRLLCLCID